MVRSQRLWVCGLPEESVSRGRGVTLRMENICLFLLDHKQRTKTEWRGRSARSLAEGYTWHKLAKDLHNACDKIPA